MKTLFAFLLFAAALHSAPFKQSMPPAGVDANSVLTSADAAILDGNLVITIQSAGTGITDWIHIFSDTGDSANFYEHSSGKAAGKGLKMLFEGGMVYQFSGQSSNVWSWTPIAGAAVTREVSGNTMVITVPAAPLGFAAGHPVHFFVAAYAPDYSDTLDTLPRANGLWSFTPKAGK